MRNFQNAAFILLAIDATAFNISPLPQKRPENISPTFTASNEIPFFAISGNSSNKSEQPPLVGEYWCKSDDSIKKFPSLGTEFTQLLGEDFYKAMYVAYAFGDDYFKQDAIAPNQVNEILLCSIEDYNKSQDAGNCYNFVTGTGCGENEEYEHQFPRGELPALSFETKEENCDSIKHDLLLEPGMRMKEDDKECEADEREIISYFSVVNKDLHFVVATPLTALPDGSEKKYYHKSSGQPAREIDKEIVESGHIPDNSAIYVVKDSKEDFDIYDPNNRKRLRFSNEETAPYEECHRFCYKIKQERQSASSPARGR